VLQAQQRFSLSPLNSLPQLLVERSLREVERWTIDSGSGRRRSAHYKAVSSPGPNTSLPRAARISSARPVLRISHPFHRYLSQDRRFPRLFKQCSCIREQASTATNTPIAPLLMSNPPPTYEHLSSDPPFRPQNSAHASPPTARRRLPSVSDQHPTTSRAILHLWSAFESHRMTLLLPRRTTNRSQSPSSAMLPRRSTAPCRHRQLAAGGRAEFRASAPLTTLDTRRRG
jgi:hypothetical protein